MDMFVIRGGTRLHGHVTVSGAKNSALPIMAAALMSDGPSLLHGIPDLVDVRTMSQLLQSLGVRCSPVGELATSTPTDSPPHTPPAPSSAFRRALSRTSQDPYSTPVPHAPDNLSILSPHLFQPEPAVVPSLEPAPGCHGYVLDIPASARPLRTFLAADAPPSAATPPATASLSTPPVRLEVHDESPCLAHYDLVRKMRASVCVLGPLLARRRQAIVSLPGGCNIGERPIDLHLKGLAALGADLRIERGYVIAKAHRLRGTAIYLGGPCGSTVTGTCNVMMAACLAEGITTIEAAACEPEVVDLGHFLNRMGARITGLGTPIVTIEGVDQLHGVEHTIIPDRIEAATLMIAAAITKGDITLHNVNLTHMTAVVEKLREIGIAIDSVADGVRVTVPHELRAADCIMLPYPGLPTDVQAQLMTLLTCVPGLSIITDKVFPDRFMHTAELTRLGARIRREGPSAILTGVPHLSGASVMASDLRASAALVLAALTAQGETTIRRIYHLDRGYNRLELKLNHLGANIHRVEDTADTSLIDPVQKPPRRQPAVADSPPSPRPLRSSSNP